MSVYFLITWAQPPRQIRYTWSIEGLACENELASSDARKWPPVSSCLRAVSWSLLSFRASRKHALTLIFDLLCICHSQVSQLTRVSLYLRYRQQHCLLSCVEKIDQLAQVITWPIYDYGPDLHFKQKPTFKRAVVFINETAGDKIIMVGHLSNSSYWWTAAIYCRCSANALLLHGVHEEAL